VSCTSSNRWIDTSGKTKKKKREEEKYLITISNPPLVGNLNANTRDVNVSMEKIVLCLWICETLIAQKKDFSSALSK
jgi:hypothetical protein